MRLLSDEVYRFLEYDEAERLAAAADCDARALSVGVMSKAFGLAGLRIGWVATRDAALRARLAAFKDYTTICASAPSELLAIVALRARARVIGRTMEILSPNLARLDAFMAAHADTLAWVRPRAGAVAFPRLLAPVPVEQFCAELVEHEGVLLLPGTLFGHAGNHFRIGFGRVDMPQALERLGERLRAR